jgi:hypothetical protein
MFAYNIYIFNRQGTCLYYYEWHRPKSVRQGAGTPADDQKMMFGLFFSLKTFAAAMDPRQCAPGCALLAHAAPCSVLRAGDCCAVPQLPRTAAEYVR